ncbi:flagellar hook-length control protein FliK [Marinomonas agarivorans]|nr:flagellar hook-length control protein FliK [Marinomonas agarivorans]
MVNFLNNLINSNPTAKSNSEGVATKNTIGTLAKLASEMQLIEGLQPIRITGSRTVFLQQAPIQLIEAMTNKNQPFSLLNSGPAIDTKVNKTAELDLNVKKQITNLVLPTKQGQPAIVPQGQSISSEKTISDKSAASQSTSQPTSTHPVGNFTTSQKPEGQTPQQIVQHPVSLKAVIQQNVTLASAVQTLHVVGNGQSLATEPAANLATQTLTTQARSASTDRQAQTSNLPNNTIYTQPKQPISLANSLTNTPPTQATATTVPSHENRQTAQINLATTTETKPQITTTAEPSSSSKPIRYDSTPTNFQSPAIQQKQTATANLNANTPTSNSTTSKPPEEATSQQQPVLRQSKTQQFTVTDGQRNFTVQSEKPLSIGSNLQVFVDQKGQLQVIPQTDTSKPTIISNALSQSLPQQFNERELTRALQELNTVMQNKNTPAHIQKAIGELLQNLPTPNELSNASLVKQSLQNSGMFLENNLLNPTPETPKDVKLSWLKLHAAAQATPSQTPEVQNIVAEQVKLSHQALERITSHQLKSLVDQSKVDQPNSPIFIELPIRDKNSTSLVQFQIERDASQPEKTPKEKRRWLAKLRFDFPETGKFEARVRVKETQAGVIFVAEEKATERAIRQHFPELKNDLEKKDIELEQLDCFCRSLSEEKVATPSDRLIDVRT